MELKLNGVNILIFMSGNFFQNTSHFAEPFCGIFQWKLTDEHRLDRQYIGPGFRAGPGPENLKPEPYWPAQALRRARPGSGLLGPGLEGLRASGRAPGITNRKTAAAAALRESMSRRMQIAIAVAGHTIRATAPRRSTVHRAERGGGAVQRSRGCSRLSGGSNGNKYHFRVRDTQDPEYEHVGSIAVWTAPALNGSRSEWSWQDHPLDSGLSHAGDSRDQSLFFLFLLLQYYD
ncbi:hypothetical protein C8J57DRAFT_1227026 [Mycena rebaudengoi]|nr:hypothetical protein C8J57DRAFT_1227026 [Mycena rebaudengoi]